MKRLILISLVFIFGAVVFAYVTGRKQALTAQVIKPLPTIAPLLHASKTQEELASLMTKSPEEIAKVDLGTLFLACLGGLPGTDKIDLDQARNRIAKLADLVKKQTAQTIALSKKCNQKFQITPEFKAYILVNILQEEYQCADRELSRYPISFVNEMLQRNRPDELFFHGSLDRVKPPEINNPTQPLLPQQVQGLPIDQGAPNINNAVLLVAVGQQLGYPMKLVAAPGHLFARWESSDGKTLFDIEETPDTMQPRYHDYYRKELGTPEDVIKEGHCFESLTPTQAFAVALQARGNCLQGLGRPAEADLAYAAAHRFAPEIPLYSEFLYTSVDSELKALHHPWKQLEDQHAYRFNLSPHQAPKEIPLEIQP